ncbi:MAG: exodeoxyribonuclease VII large subunit [bacterium]|nr:exodeoxyribonuclease VII large subunit [bacterium]
MRRVYSVSEITRNIKDTLEVNFSGIWVQGEISNLTESSAGHIYFTLKDKDSQLKTVLFKNKTYLQKVPLRSGLNIICFGYISVYEKRGEYQLYVEFVEEVGTGALWLEFERLKQKLEDEGLFSEKRKKPLPMLPRCIGVITSPTGAAIRDILSIIKRRFRNLEVLIYPVLVQGKEAPSQIVEALQYMNKQPIDILIVGRGGGSIEDLWAFNEEIVARAISCSRIPVISGIGHETDFTISDFVADVRAPTPTAAAELVVKLKETFQERLDTLSIRLISKMKNMVSENSARLKRLQESVVFIHPYRKLAEARQQVDEEVKKLKFLIHHFYTVSLNRIQRLKGKLDSLNPMKVLSRGYSITYKLPDGEIVRDVSSVASGDDVKVKVYRGEMINKVIKISP